jgi:hypothetical protein
MKLLAVFALLCILSTYAMTEQEVNSKLEKMESSKYGKTLLATIAL